MSFAEQLAARAAQKRSSSGKLSPTSTASVAAASAIPPMPGTEHSLVDDDSPPSRSNDAVVDALVSSENVTKAMKSFKRATQQQQQQSSSSNHDDVVDALVSSENLSHAMKSFKKAQQSSKKSNSKSKKKLQPQQQQSFGSALKAKTSEKKLLETALSNSSDDNNHPWTSEFEGASSSTSSPKNRGNKSQQPQQHQQQQSFTSALKAKTSELEASNHSNGGMDTKNTNPHHPASTAREPPPPQSPKTTTTPHHHAPTPITITESSPRIFRGDTPVKATRNNSIEEEEEEHTNNNNFSSSMPNIHHTPPSRQQQRILLPPQPQQQSSSRIKQLQKENELLLLLRDKGLSKEELMKENVRLSRLLSSEIGDSEELKELRQDNEDKSATIAKLSSKLNATEMELAEVTELKNAEIEVLRKQLNRAETLRTTGREQTISQAEELESNYKKERESLRDEIRRLNVEVSTLREKYEHRASLTTAEEKERERDELDGLTSRYNNNNGTTSEYNSSLIDKNTNGDVHNNFNCSSDVSSLQSIIAMMRQTIDQSNREKDLLEQRLATEQERSQMELNAFAKTLEGVDDLRKSAEIMSREIRRIKVKGYRPTRSDLLGSAHASSIVGHPTDGMRNNFGELTAAMEASENMEDAIRLIESQNDAMEERRRMGVVAGAAVTASSSAAPPTLSELASSGAATSLASSSKRGGEGGRQHHPIWGTTKGLGNDNDREGGFLSFWNIREQDDDEDDDDPIHGVGVGSGAKKNENHRKDKRKSRRRHNRRRHEEGSVLTSFF